MRMATTNFGSDLDKAEQIRVAALELAVASMEGLGTVAHTPYPYVLARAAAFENYICTGNT